MTKNKILLLGVFFICGAFLLLGASCNLADTLEGDKKGEATGRSEITEYEAGYRWDENGWIYVHIEGEPYDRGKQHGHLVAEELATIKASLEYLTYQDYGMEWSYFVDSAAAMWPQMMDDEMLNEIKGIADGANEAGTEITWEEILTMNGYEELTGYWWPNEQQKVYETMPNNVDNDHCSAFLAIGDATADGKAVMAHNSWTDFAYGENQNMILDIQPSEGHRIMMQAQPGFIQSGTDYFVMDSGLMGTETTIGGFSLYKEGEAPEFFRIRMAMQYSDTLDDFVNYMKEHNNGGYANNWLVADNNNNEIMQFELGLKFDNVEKLTNGYFIGANYPKDPRIRNLETDDSGYADIRRHQGAREVRLTQLMKEHYGKLDVDLGKKILADHYDVYLMKENNPSSRTVDGHYELDNRAFMSDPARPKPFQPRGAVDGKVMTTDMANNMSFWARWGNSSGMEFDAEKFLDEHIQWDYLRGYLDSRPSRPWTEFQAGEK